MALRSLLTLVRILAALALGFLRVGVEILRDCVKLKGGSEAAGLRFYVGGGPASDTYIDKVRAEQRKLNLVAAGAHVPTTG